MAVYKRTYRRYEGALTAEWSRFTVPLRFAWEELYRSRVLALMLLGAGVYPLVAGVIIWVTHSTTLIGMLQIPAKAVMTIDERFFLTLLGWQSMLCFFVTAFVGPGLISPDLANNAMPLYLSRPFSRFEYVLGKLSVLLILLSLMTWVPGLLLFGLQGYLAGGAWTWEHAHIARGLLAGALVWIVLLSLLALALSAWVKWRPAAGALLFGVFFVMGGFGAALNGILRTRWGSLLNISHLIGSVWLWLFDQPLTRTRGALFFRVARGGDLPVWTCWAALAAMILVCGWLLARKIRGVEVAS